MKMMTMTMTTTFHCQAQSKRDVGCVSFYLQIFQTFGDVKNGGFAFNRWADGHYNFFHFISGYPLHEGVDVQFSGSNALQWGYHAAQYMVQASVLSGILDGHHVPDAFDYTHHMAVAAGIAANHAQVFV